MMTINWMSNTYWQANGYGRYSDAMAHSLHNLGVDIRPVIRDHVTMTPWMAEKAGLDWSYLTVACMPPYYLPVYPFTERLWLLSMTEGGEMPEGWAECIHDADVERVIVPCEHNRRVFQKALNVPVHVVSGGTDPDTFPITDPPDNDAFTFVTLADRGSRKGWVEVWEAFYQEFGRPQDTPDVRLIVKSLPKSNELVDRLAVATSDPRIEFWMSEVTHPSEIWKRADCVVIPSRSEGWGMPHREAAMMGRPVIVTRYSGLDDGNTNYWAYPINEWKLEKIALPNDPHINGEWARADIGELAKTMRTVYENRSDSEVFGLKAAQWLRDNQTWEHAGRQFLELLEEYA